MLVTENKISHRNSKYSLKPIAVCIQQSLISLRFYVNYILYYDDVNY